MTPGDRPVAGRFPLGRLVMTRSAADRLTTEEILRGLVRHAAGDRGESDRRDAAENELSLRAGYRLLSAYGRGERRSRIITEADRSATTVLLPEED